jgi:hypothetical protein
MRIGPEGFRGSTWPCSSHIQNLPNCVSGTEQAGHRLNSSLMIAFLL